MSASRGPSTCGCGGPNTTEAQRTAFQALQREDLQVGRAWVLKERFRTFWEYRYLGGARTFFTRWFWRATHSRLKPMAAVAKLIQRHLPNLLTYLRHHLTNAGLEGVNAVIQWVKKTARGFQQRRTLQDRYLLPFVAASTFTHTKAGRAVNFGWVSPRRPSSRNVGTLRGIARESRGKLG
jgi:Transposase